MARRIGKPALASALVVAGVGALTIAAAWAIQLAGTPPCELCLLERDPYYVGVPLALATAAVAGRGQVRLARLGLGLLVLVFAGGAGLGAYHAGVEWQLWAGPSGCTGALNAAPDVNDFLKELQTVKVVRCDAAALRIAGLSLAGWNAVVCAALALLAASGALWGAPDRASLQA